MKNVKSFEKIDTKKRILVYLCMVAILIFFVYLYSQVGVVASAVVASLPLMLQLESIYARYQFDVSNHRVLIHNINQSNSLFEFEFFNESNVDFSNYSKFEIAVNLGDGKVLKNDYDIIKIYRNSSIFLPFEILDLTSNEFELSNYIEKVDKSSKIEHTFKYRVYNTGNQWRCMIIDEQHNFVKLNRKDRKNFSKNNK